jgi:hypothetical protein
MKKGNRHYDKWYKKLWWFVKENLCEILVISFMIITLASIVLALKYEFGL